MMGPTIRHGPHHGAQQSTSTGRPPACNTSRSKVWSVIVTGFESCAPPPAAAFSLSPHRPHLASLVASFVSSTRFFAPQLLQATTCITHLSHFPVCLTFNRKIWQINDYVNTLILKRTRSGSAE